MERIKKKDPEIAFHFISHPIGCWHVTSQSLLDATIILFFLYSVTWQKVISTGHRHHLRRRIIEQYDLKTTPAFFFGLWIPEEDGYLLVLNKTARTSQKVCTSFFTRGVIRGQEYSCAASLSSEASFTTRSN